VTVGTTGSAAGGGKGETGGVPSKVLVASADLEPAQVQDLGDIMPKLLEIKAKTNTPIRFQVRIEMGDGKTLPPAAATNEANALLAAIKEGMKLR
jgi:hypothetical protein